MFYLVTEHVEDFQYDPVGIYDNFTTALAVLEGATGLIYEFYMNSAPHKIHAVYGGKVSWEKELTK